ncbi:lipoprotein [Actinoplanes sp. NPDC049316]|uniref:lipoprotein n=1 Tax=Actinoplanes sp. NPDC049316 TaxID=3154727 RepID=UPI003448556A
MIKHFHLSAVAAGLGLVLFTGACGAKDGGTAAPAPASSAPAAAGNTAEICASGGSAARDVVVGLFSKLGAAAKDGKPDEAALTRIYRDTFGKLGDDLEAHAARATDPGLAAVLREIAAEADKVAAAPDAEAGTKGFQAALGKLEQYCPDGEPGTTSSAEPGAPADGVVGAKGSACELPVTFPVAPKWKPKAVEVADDDPLAELARKGPLRMVCEIDAKPAGHVGFLRVWSDPKGGEPRAALQPLVSGKKTRNVTYKPFTAGGQGAVEVSFEQYQELLEEHVKRRAFAVRTPGGAVVVELGTLDSSEFEAMLPAYDLAKGGLKVG